MFSSVLSALFTALFTVTALFALVRLARLTSGGQRPADRLVELFHLVMSLAMLAMTWAWSGGPESRSGLLQVVVFGAFTLWFGHALVRGLGHDRVAQSSHLTMAGSMVWMVVTMPALMGMPASPTGVGGHAGHGGHGGHGSSEPGMPGTDAAWVAAPAGWMAAVTVALAVLLAGFAVLSATRALRAGAPAAGFDPGAVTDGATAVVTVPAPRTDPVTRLAPWSHVLMNLGMAAMLVAML